MEKTPRQRPSPRGVGLLRDATLGGGVMMTKYVDMIICECCGESYPDDDYCDYCMECECCGEMTLLNDMDIDFIDLCDMEVCKKCTKSWSKKPPVHTIVQKDYYNKFEKPTMADFNGE